MIDWTQLYSQTHEFTEGAIAIASSFVGNVLGISVTTKPEYAQSRQIVGYLFQDSGGARKGYALYSGKDILILPVPQTDGLTFFPTSYLSDSYTLNIAYTTVGNILESNTAPIPDQILELPSKVSELESAFEALGSAFNPSWNAVTDKPLIFPPAEHIHNIDSVTGLSDALDDLANLPWGSIANKPEVFPPAIHIHSFGDITGLSETLGTWDLLLLELTSRVETLEAAPTSSGSVSTNSLTANVTLESNARYLATVANLVCTLPNTPAIGDLIRLSTGNFSFYIKHGNASQQVLNNNTLTVAGTDNGIVLKPYSDVDLIFLGSNLWKTTYRSRTINNFTPYTLESTTAIKTYTATAPAAQFSAVIAGAYNGIKTLGALTNGYLTNSTGGDILITFPQPVILEQVRLWNGQANVSQGASSQYSVNDMRIYTTHSPSGQDLGLYTFTDSAATEQIRNITPNTVPSTTFLLRVNGVTPKTIGIIELELWGKNALGGEVAV
jgi:hypothetical protein